MTLKKQSIRKNMHIRANGEPISKEENKWKEIKKKLKI